MALLTDYAVEGWPSMDLCGEMLLAHLPPVVTGERVCPRFQRLASRAPIFGNRNTAFNADRLLNRFFHFPRHAQRNANRFDFFHVVDHSYAQLVHALPSERTGVYCHDLDAFRCLLEPKADPRPEWFRLLARRILTGLQKAAVVFHSTMAVRNDILRTGVVDPARLVHAPYGMATEFTAESNEREPAWMQSLTGRPFVLHVGSCVPRKGIDVLLDVVASLRLEWRELLLVKVGGDWSATHCERIARHSLQDAIVHVRDLSRAELAAVYRRASAVLMPSEAEGFGLPVVEALACGANVVASDIAPLREVGGPAANYAPVGDVPAWAATVVAVMTGGTGLPQRAERLAWAARFSWPVHADTIARAYLQLACG